NDYKHDVIQVYDIIIFFFFFQAEDGIRDFHVTGVQTCALPILNDSKQLKEKDRYYLREVIQENALSYAVAYADHEEIDSINILKASFLAMHRAIEKLFLTPEFILVDGNRFFPYFGIPHQCIIVCD